MYKFILISTLAAAILTIVQCTPDKQIKIEDESIIENTDVRNSDNAMGLEKTKLKRETKPKKNTRNDHKTKVAKARSQIHSLQQQINKLGGPEIMTSSYATPKEKKQMARLSAQVSELRSQIARIYLKRMKELKK